MKKIITVLILIMSCACSTPKSKTDNSFKRDISVKTAEFGVVQVPIISDSDTLILNELRFYTINSALNSIKMMSGIYGNSNMELEGRYQSNLPQMVWKNKEILNNDELYTISACGTETATAYFASIAIFDSEKRDCLDNSHPDRQKLIDFFVSKMYVIAN
jgi:hypothetical protein